MDKDAWRYKKANYRGVILELGVGLENKLVSFIESEFFNKNDDEIKNVFREHVLEAEFFTLAKKINISVILLKNKKILSEDDIKKLADDLKRCMHIRNMFAHGKIESSDFEYSVKLYEKDGEILDETEKSYDDSQGIILEHYADKRKFKKISPEEMIEYIALFKDSIKKVKDLIESDKNH